MEQVVEIFTDGACRGNPGIGGWGVLIRYGEAEKKLYGGEIIGGDLVRSNELFISIVATGFCKINNNKPLIMKRNSAKPGDVVAVTGFLGNSSGGLTLLKENLTQLNPCFGRGDNEYLKKE